MRDQITKQIETLQREKAEFALVANARAEERVNALRVQIEVEISVRLLAYEQRIADLTALLQDPALIQ